MTMANAALEKLRRRIARHKFLWIIDDASSDTDLAVHDRRHGNLGTSIDSEESLDYLIEHGAEVWLESRFNGMSKDVDDEFQ